MELFRRAAIDARRNRLAGEVRLSLPPYITILFCVLVVGLTSIALIVAFGQFTAKERVVGWVVPEGGFVRVSVPRSGVVSQLEVSEGDHVERGTTLALVRPDTSRALIAETVDRNIGVMLEEARGVRRSNASKYDAERRSIAQEMTAAREQRNQVAQQVQLQRERLTLQEQQLQEIKPLLEKGFVSKLSVRQREMDVLSSRQSLAGLLSELAAANRAISEAATKLARTSADFDIAEAASAQDIARLENEAASAQGSALTLIRSPVAGRVSRLERTTGDAVAEAEPFALIVPQRSRLQVELFVPTRAAGGLRRGTPVQLDFEAFAEQSFGSVRGRVVRMASKAMMGASPNMPFEAREPMFSVLVEIDAASAKVPIQRLIPGMTVTADVPLERRPIWRWLFPARRPAKRPQ